jgi:hypothetical protein
VVWEWGDAFWPGKATDQGRPSDPEKGARMSYTGRQYGRTLLEDGRSCCHPGRLAVAALTGFVSRISLEPGLSPPDLMAHDRC